MKGHDWVGQLRAPSQGVRGTMEAVELSTTNPNTRQKELDALRGAKERLWGTRGRSRSQR